MSTRKLKRPADAPSEQSSARPSAPGRVVFDSRGNPVWQWNTDAGDSTTVLLAQLENEDLALEPTRKVKSVGEREWPDRLSRPPVRTGPAANQVTKTRKGTGENLSDLDDRVSGKGFDPYNNS